mmetsp:Transcript_17297/g.56608  ORF Transcript_17297/g.56608 Transcript_17297/m.56608 type:complete len:213 (+) Transcript_17297:646-1284(+)
MALPIALIQSSFSLSVAATKNIVSVLVLSSNALARLMASSAPLTERHLLTSRTPRNGVVGSSLSVLNQKILPCLSTKKRLRHVFTTAPCFCSQPLRSAPCQNSTERSSGVGALPWMRDKKFIALQPPPALLLNPLVSPKPPAFLLQLQRPQHALRRNDVDVRLPRAPLILLERNCPLYKCEDCVILAQPNISSRMPLRPTLPRDDVPWEHPL